MSFEQYLGNVNLKIKTELIAGLSDHHRQVFCWTDAVFAGLGHWSTRLFRRLLLWYISVKFESEFYHFHSRKCNWNCRLSKRRSFFLGLNVLKEKIACEKWNDVWLFLNNDVLVIHKAIRQWPFFLVTASLMKIIWWTTPLVSKLWLLMISHTLFCI